MLIINKIHNLPIDIINLIKEYIPKKELAFTNKEHYLQYHSYIKSYIKDFDNYVKNTIRRDNDIVMYMIIRENYKLWYEHTNYIYKNMIFKNYIYFIIHYCIESDSTNCMATINKFLKEHELCKNLHKKNVVKYIRWKD
jgi:hypothetical protein